MKVVVISLFGYSSSGRIKKIINNVFANDSTKIITSDFNHGEKKYYSLTEKLKEENVTRLHVPSYKKNLSIKRIWSHCIFARKLKKSLEKLSPIPDLVYCAMPSSTAGYIAGKYCQKKRIPLIVDVIDVWPDSLIPIVPFKKILEICVLPWKYITHKAYKMSSYISGESRRYAEIAHNINPKVPYSYTYLGVDSDQYRKLIASSSVTLEKPEDEIWIGYGGSLGQSYDFDVILKGLKYLDDSGIKYKMWFVGEGEKSLDIKKHAAINNLNVEITGRLAYGDLLKYLSYCDITINSFKPGTLVVHSYKFNDYIASGCYVLNNLPGETSEMIEKYQVGANFDSSTFNSVLLKSIKEWDTIKLDLPNRIEKLKKQELETSIIYSKLKDNISKNLKNI